MQRTTPVEATPLHPEGKILTNPEVRMSLLVSEDVRRRIRTRPGGPDDDVRARRWTGLAVGRGTGPLACDVMLSLGLDAGKLVGLTTGT